MPSLTGGCRHSGLPHSVGHRVTWRVPASGCINTRRTEHFRWGFFLLLLLLFSVSKWRQEEGHVGQQWPTTASIVPERRACRRRLSCRHERNIRLLYSYGRQGNFIKDEIWTSECVAFSCTQEASQHGKVVYMLWMRPFCIVNVVKVVERNYLTSIGNLIICKDWMLLLFFLSFFLRQITLTNVTRRAKIELSFGRSLWGLKRISFEENLCASVWLSVKKIRQNVFFDRCVFLNGNAYSSGLCDCLYIWSPPVVDKRNLIKM